jgi:hypothetical protein
MCNAVSDVVIITTAPVILMVTVQEKAQFVVLMAENKSIVRA